MSRLAVLLVVSLLGATAGAAAKDRVVKEAEARFKRANQLYKEGRYQEALLLYQAAYDLVPSTSILFNLGLTKEKVLDYEGCALAFEQYVREGGDDPEAAKTRADACRARTRIVVTLTSAPAGAALLLGDGEDARLLGRTPATLDLAPGTYDVRLELDGYVGQRQRVAVEIGTRPRYDYVLEKLATLRIEADVAGALVRVDDGPEEPAPIERVLPAGSYHVRVSKPGHVAVERTIKVASGSDVQLAIALPVVPPRQKLRLRSLPAASIAIDGTDAGLGEAERELPPGLHVVEARASGHVPFRGQIVLPAGHDIEASVRLPARRSRVQTAVLVGLGAGALAFGTAGGIYGMLALDAEAAYADMPSLALHDEGLDHRFRADLLLGTAVVVGGVTVIYWLVTRPGPSSLEVVR